MGSFLETWICDCDPNYAFTVALYRDVVNAKSIKEKAVKGEINCSLIKPEMVGFFTKLSQIQQKKFWKKCVCQFGLASPINRLLRPSDIININCSTSQAVKGEINCSLIKPEMVGFFTKLSQIQQKKKELTDWIQKS